MILNTCARSDSGPESSMHFLLRFFFLQLSSIWNKNCAAEAENALTEIKTSHFMNRKLNLDKTLFLVISIFSLSCLCGSDFILNVH